MNGVPIMAWCHAYGQIQANKETFDSFWHLKALRSDLLCRA